MAFHLMPHAKGAALPAATTTYSSRLFLKFQEKNHTVCIFWVWLLLPSFAFVRFIHSLLIVLVYPFLLLYSVPLCGQTPTVHPFSWTCAGHRRGGRF